MKKRYIFIAIYIAVIVFLGLPALFNIKLSVPYELQPQKYRIMLTTSSIMAVLLVFALLIWRIVKFILVKMGKMPDDYFVYIISAPKSLEHAIWTRRGIYRKEEDPAEIKRDMQNKERRKR